MSAAKTVAIRINERVVEVSRPATLDAIRRRHKPDADLVILNGFPVEEEVCCGTGLDSGDEVVLIRRGEVPSRDELETLLVARHGPGVHARLKAAHVGIAGCGGLGSTLAIALARSGIGSLTLVDFDVVEPSNLNRQQYFVDQIGLYKVEALAANLERINPYVRLAKHQLKLTQGDVPDLFGSCDIVAECFDSPAAKAELAMAMRRFLPQTPLVAVSGIAGHGPASDIVSRRVFGNHFLIGDRVSAAQPKRGLLAPRVSVAAGVQANVVIRWLLGAIAQHEGE